MAVIDNERLSSVKDGGMGEVGRRTGLGRWLGWVAGGLFAVGLSACSDAPEPTATVRPVRTQWAMPSTQAAAASYPATLQARRESAHAFQVSGRVVERAVQLGERVTRGQLLARIDAQDYQLSQQAARAQLAAADVELQQARADLDRFEALHAQGFISAADIEHRRAAAQASQARHQQARAQYQSTVNQADYTRLLASLDGVVTRVEAEVGQVLAAGQPALFVAQSSQLDAVFQVPEQQALRLQQGDEVQVKVWAAPTGWRARVRERSAAADPLTRTFLIKAELEADTNTLRPGMSATVETAAAASTGTLLPLHALLRGESGQAAVWVLDAESMTVRRQPVRLLSVGDQLAQVSGLPERVEVVTAGVHQLQDGQRVQRLAEPEPAPTLPQRLLDSAALPRQDAQP
ncbi:MAG: efflux RND transporter periplasmic adaptor subunit [Pigmentiphaga sp.]